MSSLAAHVVVPLDVALKAALIAHGCYDQLVAAHAADATLPELAVMAARVGCWTSSWELACLFREDPPR